ncbi:signal peptide peptidase SppA [Hippea maritima]|uniref:Signal peptide peptidase SppA, 36K type n=1 Tax=Hippea maritima (strain ATCC 700847 / DSM 10411 / MH2) TaxID=760142 RepID=F2LXQ4_HIPMA|nr:signal peptide peptidase SppA [Hippea maritima]AEA34295.1 signal peptide peptidase SppA, 36K type [Hippea maritima DSM 10411]
MIKKATLAVVLLTIIVFIVSMVYFAFNVPNVAVLSINGVINQKKTDNWIRALNKIKRESNIKAVLLKIDSPGGEAVSSQRLYFAIKDLSKTKPVVCLIETIGASGAYYAASASNKIVSYPASIIGSIGVLFETLNVAKLSKRLGVKAFVVKSGKLKDAGNPFREPTKEDEEMINNVVNDIYNQFLDDVARGRNMESQKLKRYANGSIFSGRLALKIGLVDSTGGLKDAKKYIKRLTKIKKIKLYSFNRKPSTAGKLLKGLAENIIELLERPSVKAIYQ